jgi:hypothetical protein
LVAAERLKLVRGFIDHVEAEGETPIEEATPQVCGCGTKADGGDPLDRIAHGRED